MNRISVLITAELYKMFFRCTLEFNIIYVFRIPEINRLITMIKLKSGNGVPKCGYSIYLFIYLFIFYIHMRPDLSYDGWPRTIPKEASVGPMFLLAT